MKKVVTMTQKHQTFFQNNPERWTMMEKNRFDGNLVFGGVFIENPPRRRRGGKKWILDYQNGGNPRK